MAKNQRKSLTARKDKATSATPQKSANLDASAQEQVLNKLQKKDGKRTVQRITVDMPQQLYEQTRQEIQYTGQTLKGFVVSLIRNHFKNKEQEG